MTNLFAIGVSHKNSSLKFREALARLWDGKPEEALRGIKSHFNGTLGELCLVSTCNRFELYMTGSKEAPQAVREYLHSKLGSARPQEDSLDCLEEKDALRHLFLVASGLESMVIGETEVLGQVKLSYETARALGLTGSALNSSFQRALYVGKKVRSQTGVSRGRLSVASVAVELAQKIFTDFSSLTVAIVGAGAMGSETAKNLLNVQTRAKLFVSRRKEKAEVLAREFGGSAFGLEDLDQVLRASDIVVTQLSSETPVITHAQVARVIEGSGRSIFFLDIALPRNVEDSVSLLPNVYLYNIDDLKAVAQANLERRKSEVERARKIVEEELDKFSARCQTNLKFTGELEPVVPVLR